MTRRSEVELADPVTDRMHMTEPKIFGNCDCDCGVVNDDTCDNKLA